jgi:signal transduction histidine kinase
LIVAMSVMALGYVVGGLSNESFVRLIGRETREILVAAVPSAQRLVSVRTGVRSVDAAVDAALLAVIQHRPFDRHAIAEARRQIDAELDAYHLMPSDEREAQLYEAVIAEAGRLDHVMRRVLRTLEQGDVGGASWMVGGEWRQASDALDGRVRDLMVYNTYHLATHVDQISRIWRIASLVGIGLGVLNILLTAIATTYAARSISRQTRLQEERIAELEMFADRVAHDLMSPIAAVGLALQVLRDRPSVSSAPALTSGALAAVRRVQLVVDGLLGFARSGARPAPGARAGVIEIVNGVVDEMRPAADDAGIQLLCEPLSACEVACAPGVLSVVLSNLVANAIKYMGHSTERRVTVRIRVLESRVRIEVADTGPGLPSGFDRVVFNPYVRGPSPTAAGLGLGLGTVRRLVEAHGGSVGVHSIFGAGALFWFELPGAQPPLV